MNTNTYDAIVVGARCAGAATAMLMARGGMKVLLVERAEPGTDTVSSHNLTRGAVSQLARWGLVERLLAAGTPRIARTTFHFGERVLPIDLKTVMGAPGVMGPRRPLLDMMLANEAKAAGADVRFDTSFRDVLLDEEGRIVAAVLTDGAGMDIRVSAPLVVGADGIRSTVARRVGAAVRREAVNSLGHIYGYFRNLDLGENHAYFAPGVMVGSMPTNDGSTVVIASTHDEALRSLRTSHGDEGALRALARLAHLGFANILDKAQRVEQVRAFAATKGFMRDCVGSGWALVGDAGYFRDPVTAHGVTDAFRDAEILARTYVEGGVEGLRLYQQKRDAVTSEIWHLTDRIAAFDMSMVDLAEAFHDLSRAMRAEQDWMACEFAPEACAA